MSLKEMLPELNENQWKLLERTILDCLPEMHEYFVSLPLRPSIGGDWERQSGQMFEIGFNKAITKSATAITNVFNEGDKV